MQCELITACIAAQSQWNIHSLKSGNSYRDVVYLPCINYSIRTRFDNGNYHRWITRCADSIDMTCKHTTLLGIDTDAEMCLLSTEKLKKHVSLSGKLCVKLKNTALHGISSQSYRMSLVIYDHSVTFHPTQVNTTLRLNPSQTGWYSTYLPWTDGRLSWPRWLVTYRDGIPTHRRSPIQLLTRQCMARNRTRNLLITSLTP